jgi:hypothetical protein
MMRGDASRTGQSHSVEYGEVGMESIEEPACKLRISRGVRSGWISMEQEEGS